MYNQRCYHSDEYKVHRNFKQVLCKKSGCDEMTRFAYEFCDTHAKKYRVKEHYYQKKLIKIALMQILIGNLEIKNTI